MELSIKEIITLCGFVSAGIWFYWTQKFKPRVEFDIDCDFFFPSNNSEEVIAEIRFIFRNKGLVQHTIKFLELSIHGLENDDVVKPSPDTQNVIFKEEIFKRHTVVPENAWGQTLQFTFRIFKLSKNAFI